MNVSRLVSPRYRPFGAFRFGLAMMVVLQHGLLLLAPSDRQFLYSLEMGAVAVTTFFALSGFIVAEASATFYAGRPGAFLANRALRVVPLTWRLGLLRWRSTAGCMRPGGWCRWTPRCTGLHGNRPCCSQACSKSCRG